MITLKKSQKKTRQENLFKKLIKRFFCRVFIKKMCNQLRILLTIREKKVIIAHMTSGIYVKYNMSLTT